jgi:putative hydroxymethylpyrimidine transporter CytX
MADLEAAAREVGIEPVPPDHPRMSGWDMGVLWSSLGVSFLVMVVGMFLVPGLSLGQALLAILVGALIGNCLLGIASAIGSDVRVPTMVLLRAPLGVRGSYIPTGLNILQLLGWATLEVIVMAQAADVLASRVFGFPSAYSLWIVVFTALTLIMALAGPILVTRRWLEKFAVWAALLTTVWLGIAILTTYDIAAMLAQPGTGAITFWLGVDLVVALPISWFPLVADYSRFAVSRRAAFWGTGVGYFIPHVAFYTIGAFLALAGTQFNPTAPVVPLLGAIATLTAGWIALLVLLVVETDEAFANVYSTALSIQNWFPQARQRALIVGICAVVLVVGLLVPLTQYESFLLLIGAFFVPLLGVLAADYFVVQRQRYEVGELYQPGGRYAYQGGFNLEALAVWLVGIVLYLGIAGLPIGFGETVGPWLGMEKLTIGGLASWLGGTLPSFVAVFVLHSVLGRLTAPRPALAVARP